VDTTADRSTFAIGQFARATQISAKMLRHYHRIGLLEPAAVDPFTGYRRYTPEQIPVAQVIRRFRDLDMPLDRIRAVLAAPDPQARNSLIAAHLAELQRELTHTQLAVSALRDLLEPAPPATIGQRTVEATPAAAISAVIELADAQAWHQGALGELYATLDAQGRTPAGPAGGIFADELFAEEHGRATVFVPCRDVPRPTGRIETSTVPAVELATITHVGSHQGIDRAYGELAAYVARHALAVDGPIREYYLVGRHETADQGQWRTEIGWPIFHTGALADGSPQR